MGDMKTGGIDWARILPFTVGLLLLGPWRVLTPYAGYELIVHGYPYTGATLLAVGIPITAACFLLALPPAWARRWALRHSLDLNRLGHVTALLILLLVFLYLLGNALSSFAYGFEANALPTQITGFQLVRMGVANLLCMGGGAIAYTRLVQGKNLRQTMYLLKVKRRGQKLIAILLCGVG